MFTVCWPCTWQRICAVSNHLLTLVQHNYSQSIQYEKGPHRNLPINFNSLATYRVDLTRLNILAYNFRSGQQTLPQSMLRCLRIIGHSNGAEEVGQQTAKRHG